MAGPLFLKLPPAVAVIAVDEPNPPAGGVPGAYRCSQFRIEIRVNTAACCRRVCPPLSLDTPSDSSPAASPESAAVDSSSERVTRRQTVGSGSCSH